MAVNVSSGFFSKSTIQSESNCSSEDAFFECTASLSSFLLLGFSSFMNIGLLLPLNCWILWLARRSGIASSDFVIFNQSFAELIADVFIIVFMLGTLLHNNVIILISVFMCSAFIIGRPLFQTYFCVERYLAVVHPLVYLRYTRSPKLKLPLVALVWLIVMIFGWFVVQTYPGIPTFYIGPIIVMLVVCSFCSAMILWVLKRPKPGDSENAGSYQLKRKAFISVTVILITLVFGYGTVSCVVALKDHLPLQTFCLALNISWCALLPSAAVQPYLYLSKIGKLPCIKFH